MKRSWPLVAWLAAGCAAAPVDPPEPAADQGECRITGLADLVGRPATAELGREAMRRSAATSLRWMRPGGVVTMEYRPGRLNVRLDGQNRVSRFVCG